MKTSPILVAVLAATLATARAETPAEIVTANAKNLASQTIDERLAARDAIQAAGAQASRPGAEAERVAYAKAALNFLAPSNPQPSRVWLTRMLGLFGGEESVSALAGLLGDSDVELRDAARRALQANPSPKAADALRAALASAKDPLAIRALMDGLANRRDTGSVDAIAKRLTDADVAVSSAAALALGKIGDPKAVAALVACRTRASDALRHDIDRALLDAPSADAKALGPLADAGTDPTVRSGALARLLQADPAAATSKVSAAIKDKDPVVASAALRLAIDSKSASMRKSAIDAIPGLAPGIQAVAATALGEAGAIEAAPALRHLLESPDAPTRVAAITALGKVGGADCLDPLLDRLANGDQEEQAAAERAFAVIRDPALDARLIQSAKLASGPLALASIRATAARNPAGGATVFADLVKATDATIRDAALDGLKSIGSITELKPLLEMLATSADAKARSKAQSAAGAIASRAADRAAVLDAIRGAMGRAASPANRAELVNMLAAAPGKDSLEEVLKAFGDNDQAVRDAAIRTLAGWPEFSAGHALLQIAKDSPADAKQYVLAMRGIAKILGIEAAPGKERVALARESIAAAKRPDEKKIIIAAVANIKAGEARKFLEQLSEDPEVGQDATAALKKLKK
ncbi:MAG TPA: HEAT repeat domain-containing protein [Verrucomicrobiae bacterium]|nr:HEAT repeat domain-containing protein [Verrucomicrobiae bacterium]